MLVKKTPCNVVSRPLIGTDRCPCSGHKRKHYIVLAPELTERYCSAGYGGQGEIRGCHTYSKFCLILNSLELAWIIDLPLELFGCAEANRYSEKNCSKRKCQKRPCT